MSKDSGWAIAFLIPITLFLGVIGYFIIMANFSFYDDEGLVIYALKNFLQGNALYDEVYTQYGGAYYLIHELIMKCFHLLPDHNNIRLISLVFWCLGSFFLAWAVHRFTRNIFVACISLLLSFVESSVIINEPGHPQALLYVLLSLTVFSITFLPQIWAFITIGVCCGLCFSVKINVGIYMILGIGWSMLSLAHSNRLLDICKKVIGALILIFPVVLMRDKIAEVPFFYYLFISLIAIISLYLVNPSKNREKWPLSGILYSTLSFVVIFFFVNLIVLVRGTSLPGLYEGLIGQHLAFAQVFWLTPPFRKGNLINAILSFALCLIYIFTHRRNQNNVKFINKFNNFLNLTKLAVVGFSLFYTRSLDSTLPRLMLLILFSWSWLFILPPLSAHLSRDNYFQRYTLLSLGTLYFLIAYPVAGSQLSWSIILIIPIFSLFLSDLLKLYFNLSYKGIFLKIFSIGFVTVLVGLTFIRPYRKTKALIFSYFNNQSSTVLLGSSLIRLPKSRMSVYEKLTLNIRGNARHLLTTPGMYSFSIWSGVDSPTRMNQTNWPFVLDDTEQQKIVDKISPLQKVIVVYSERAMKMWNTQKTPPAGPLLNYIKDNFVMVKSFGDYQLLVRKSELQDFKSYE
jgi:hypothetical protein